MLLYYNTILYNMLGKVPKGAQNKRGNKTNH